MPTDRVNGGFEQGAEGWTLKGGKLVTDPEGAKRKQARKGRNCVFGEVTKPKQACSIERTFTLETGSIYRISFWARAKRTKGQKPGRFGVKAVVWINNNKEKIRRSVGLVKNIPGRWRSFSMPFSVAKSGQWRVQIVAPSSHGALLGQAWVDEVSRIEIKLPPLVDITNDDRFNERPALAASGDGSAYCAWFSFKDGKDRIHAARLTNVQADKPEVAIPDGDMKRIESPLVIPPPI